MLLTSCRDGLTRRVDPPPPVPICGDGKIDEGEECDGSNLAEQTCRTQGFEAGQAVAVTATDYGRDHHPRCFTILMAGAGIKKGLTYGLTDDYCYNILEQPVHVHDLNATILHLMGIDHTRLTYRYQGRDFRLTDIHGEVIHPVLA